MDRRIWKHPYPDPQLHLDISAVGGVDPIPYFDSTMRSSNNLPSSNLSVEIPNHLAANPGTSHNPYLHSSASSSSRMPPDYVQTGPPFYNHFANGHAGISVDPQMEYGRALFKRKNADISMDIDRGNTNVYYSAGSSSNMPIPSTLPPNPTPGAHYRAWDPVSMPLCHGSYNPPTAGEGSHRNVRSRQSHTLGYETDPTGVHSFSNLSHHHTSTNGSGLAAAGQWSHPPVCLNFQRRVLSSGSGGFNHEMNHSLAGSSGVNHNLEIGVGYPPISVHNRSPSTPLPAHHGMPSQVVGVGHSSYGLGTAHYSAMSSSSYQSVGTAAIHPPRHSRPLSNVGWINERNRRPRIIYDRLQPFSSGDSAHSRWEGVSLMDRSTIYDSRNLFDQHRDMRLDIDNMSYEELLALGERIGSVSTGLSENTIPSCLKESVYCSSEVLEEGNCVICMEEYKDKETLGRLDCGHDFHTGCIKEWLLIKNVCPICKSAASPDTST